MVCHGFLHQVLRLGCLLFRLAALGTDVILHAQELLDSLPERNGVFLAFQQREEKPVFRHDQHGIPCHKRRGFRQTAGDRRVDCLVCCQDVCPVAHRLEVRGFQRLGFRRRRFAFCRLGGRRFRHSRLYLRCRRSGSLYRSGLHRGSQMRHGKLQQRHFQFHTLARIALHPLPAVL